MGTISRVDRFCYLSTETKPTNVPAHSELIESDTGNKFRFNGTSWQNIGIAGSEPVIVGLPGVHFNRNINAASSTFVAATNSATWLSTLGLKTVKITPLITTTQGAAQNGQACLYIINAGSAAVAAAAFADTGDIASTVMYGIILAGQTLEKILDNSDALTDVYVLPIGTGNTVMRVVIEAGGGAS
jgi:hypothetical protein